MSLRLLQRVVAHTIEKKLQNNYDTNGISIYIVAINLQQINQHITGDLGHAKSNEIG